MELLQALFSRTASFELNGRPHPTGKTVHLIAHRLFFGRKHKSSEEASEVKTELTEKTGRAFEWFPVF